MLGVQEISAAETELERLCGGRPGTAKSGIAVEAAILTEEAGLVESATLEGLVDDEQMRYFLSVGNLENSIKDLRTLKQLKQDSISQNSKSLVMEKKEIQKVASFIERFEKEIRENDGVDKEDQLKKVNQDKRLELTKNTRANKLALKEFKLGLRDFLNDTETLTPGYNEDQDSSRFGHILQALWKNYTENGIHDYVSIESLEFDVETDVLEHLKRAGLVFTNSKNKDQIRLVDFTQ